MSERETCPVCKGTGKIRLPPFGLTKTCQTCKGCGVVPPFVDRRTLGERVEAL